MGPLPQNQKGHKYILVIDYFIKWAEAYPMVDQEASTIADQNYQDMSKMFMCSW